MHAHWIRVIAIAALGAVALSGCAAYQQKSRTKSLELQSQAYVKAIRWSKFDSAVGFLRARNGRLPPTNLNDYAGIRVTSSNMTLSSESADATEAQMIAVFNYYRSDQASVRSVTQTADWWWDDLDQAWYLDSGLPEF